MLNIQKTGKSAILKRLLPMCILTGALFWAGGKNPDSGYTQTITWESAADAISVYSNSCLPIITVAQSVNRLEVNRVSNGDAKTYRQGDGGIPLDGGIADGGIPDGEMAEHSVGKIACKPGEDCFANVTFRHSGDCLIDVPGDTDALLTVPCRVNPAYAVTEDIGGCNGYFEITATATDGTVFKTRYRQIYEYGDDYVFSCASR